MRVLVIGGTGFIGKHVVTELSILGHHVTVYHRGEREPRLPFSVEHVHSPLASRPVLEFPPELTALAMDVVLGTHVMGERDARAIMRAFRDIARRVVLLSSGDVYRAYGIVAGSEAGPLEPVPLTEDSPVRQTLYPHRAAAATPADWRHDYEKMLADNVGEREAPAMIERARAVARAAGWTGEVLAVSDEELPPEERRPGNFAQDILYDTSRIREDLDYEEIVSEEEGLRRTIAWER
jgi:nucleoside-diphosphate-sugar epimerase